MWSPSLYPLAEIIYASELVQSKSKLNRMKVALVIIPITNELSAEVTHREKEEKRKIMGTKNRAGETDRELQNKITTIKSIHLRRLSYGSDRNGKHLSLNLKGLENRRRIYARCINVCMALICKVSVLSLFGPFRARLDF